MTEHPDIAILIPAAGASSRMGGRDKLIELADGQPLIARQARIALKTGANILITLPPDKPNRRTALDPIHSDRLHIQVISDAAEGIGGSIRAGATWASARQASGLMIVLADLPDLQTSDLKSMMQAFDFKNILRASDQSGTPGHPVIFPVRLYDKLTLVRGDQGAKSVLGHEDVITHLLPDHRATTDLDTPQHWSDWRARTGH